MEFIDTHCHIHEIEGDASSDQSVAARWHDAGVTNAGEVIAFAKKARINRMICVGTTVADSKLAINFVQDRPECYASIGVHPHEAKSFVHDHEQIAKFLQFAEKPKVVAVGECGLDYFYNNSPKTDQIKALEIQLQLAADNDLPLIFHVREAFDDFWPIIDNFKSYKLRGVVHSFTADQRELQRVMYRNFLVGLNGIMTFTKDNAQLEMAKAVPLETLVLETDAPFLTPAPFRGKICEVKHVRTTAEFLSHLRGDALQEIASHTTQNAVSLFNV